MRNDRSAAPEAFRRTMSAFTTGVTVVTTRSGDVLHGMTANAFASVSLDPPLVLVCIDVTAGLHELLDETGEFAVTILSAEQAELSVWFASRRRPHGQDQFAGVPWRPAPVSGAPVLLDGIAFLDCRVTEVYEGGDHSIFLGEVIELGDLRRDADPLLWYGSTYHRLAEPLSRSRTADRRSPRARGG
jgi:flavin reductase (DIM6/NTAB) family NADH-FMN oxidoreductase RutF